MPVPPCCRDPAGTLLVRPWSGDAGADVGRGAEAATASDGLQPTSLPQLPPGCHSWAWHPRAALCLALPLPWQAPAHAGFAGTGQDPQAEGRLRGLWGEAC